MAIISVGIAYLMANMNAASQRGSGSGIALAGML